jgi:hypothetical protein
VGIADRDYTRERYRQQRGLPLNDVRWDDRKGRCERDKVDSSEAGETPYAWLGPRWRARIRQHQALKKKLIEVSAIGVVAMGAVIAVKTHPPLAARLSDISSKVFGERFPASGAVTVSPLLDLDAVASRLTLQGAARNAVVQMLDAHDGRHRLSVYVRAGERITVPAPLGQYRIRLIRGDDWRGRRTFFGKGTVQDEVVGVMLFTRKLGHTLDLRLGADSNLVVRRIAARPAPLQ